MAALVLAVLAGGLLLWQRPWDGATAERTVVPIPADAASSLTAQFRDLSAASTREEFLSAAGELAAGRDFGRRTWASLTALDATDVSLRYISGGDVADRADGSATAVAEVTWRPGPGTGLGADSLHRSSVAFRVAPQRDGGFSVVDATPRTSLLPIWLAGRIEVDRRDGAVVIDVDRGDSRLPIASMASTARSAVERTLPDVRGDVVVIAPRTQEQMAVVVGQDVSAVQQIAAVTTRLDRSGTNGHAVVVLNPAVFATMDRRAAQVVLSHEATHLLTGAVGTRAETWVVEGFADYVALRDDTAPLSISAGQVLAEVRAGRPPADLPDAAAFDETSHGLGAVYESAWMIFRMLDADHGSDDVVAFYRAVIDDTPWETALQDSFGLTPRELTAQWRTYLTKSASTVS